MYKYACEKCQHEFDEFQHMSDEPLTDCPECGEIALVRVPQRCGSLNREYQKPIEAYSIALDDEDEIRAFQVRNPGTQISTDRSDPLFGVPVIRTRAEKKRVYKQEGVVETN
jgi:putative FmdB family regulatory protein